MDVISYLGLLLPVLLSILNTACCVTTEKNCTAIYTENGVKKTKVSECYDGCCGSTEDRHCCEEKEDASFAWLPRIITTVSVIIIVVVIVVKVKRWQWMQRHIENQRRQIVPEIQMHNSSEQPPTYNEATTQQNYPGPQTNSGQQNNYYASKDYHSGPKGYPVQSAFPPTYSAFVSANPS